VGNRYRQNDNFGDDPPLGPGLDGIFRQARERHRTKTTQLTQTSHSYSLRDLCEPVHIYSLSQSYNCCSSRRSTNAHEGGGRGISAMSTAAVHTSNAAHLIEAVHDLGPTINAMREEIERERRLPVHLVETLR
jgi:hypothetical protein